MDSEDEYMSDPLSQGEDEFEGTQDSDNESFGEGEYFDCPTPAIVHSQSSLRT